MAKIHVLIKFEDGSTREYEKAWSEQHASFIHAAKQSLFDRLQKLGRDAGNPLSDLREFNGNHATGRGRHPGPKAVEIVKEWID
jgi:hypothetical protein